jgi:acyl carrier protein
MKLSREEIKSKLLQIISQQLKIDKNSINPQATLESLGADSLDRVEIIMKIEEEFALEISDEDSSKLSSLDAAIDYIYNQKT